jgi:pyruvate,water dikinase
MQEISQSGEQMAVVIMEMVQASVAGVAFSVNPITGNRNQIMINASWGLGESVVAGRVTPDSVVAAKSDGSTTAYDLGAKATEVVVDPHSGRGAIERPVPPERAATRCLSNADIRAIVDLTRRAEQYYGQPQDIEFAIANARLYLLQARPITGLA